MLNRPLSDLPAAPVLDRERLRQALLKKFDSVTAVVGHLSFPCYPEGIDRYVRRADKLLRALGQEPQASQLQKLEDLVARKLREAADAGEASPEGNRDRIHFKFDQIDPTRGLTEGVKTATKLVREKHLLPAVSAETFDRFTTFYAQAIFPCVPALAERALERIVGIFRALDCTLSAEEIERIRASIARDLGESFARSPHARLCWSLRSPHPTRGLSGGLQIQTKTFVESMTDKYAKWMKYRPKPLFGKHPNAKVVETAATFSPASDRPVLDVGAGTGRNSYPLARKGYTVDAVEMTPDFAAEMTAIARQENLPLQVTCGNILDPLVRMPLGRYRFAFVVEVVSHFRSLQEVRLLLSKIADCLQPGGLLLLDLFLAVPDYQPDEIARQMSQVAWSFMLTREEFRQAIAGLPFAWVSDESVLKYERARFPAEAWPPTTWYRGWATGRNTFLVPAGREPPVELRWVLCERL